MAFIIDKLKVFIETLTFIEQKLGIRKFIQYILFIAVIYVFFNFNSIIENVIRVQTEISKKKHERKIELRDQMMTELNPLLVELRSKTGACRILYFEYHNSTENFVGIPFKYANLVLMNNNYNCASFDPTKYRDINSGLLSSIYDDLKKEGIIIVKQGEVKYKDIQDFFTNQDGSKEQVFINLPGVYFPMGIIILEWVDEKNEIDPIDLKPIIHKELPRINALISRITLEIENTDKN